MNEEKEYILQSNQTDTPPKESMHDAVCRTLLDTSADSLRGWLVVLGAFLGNFVALGSVYSFGVLLLPITLDFHVGRGTASWIGSMCVASMLLCSAFAGLLCQKYGFSAVAWAGGVIVALFHAISSYMPNAYLMFLTYGLCVGFGYSLCFMPGYAATGQWFERYRGLATGVAVAGSGIGNLVFPFVIELLLVELADWRSVMRCLGLIALLFMTISGFLLANRFPLSSAADSGQHADYSYLRPVARDPAAWKICAFNAIVNVGWLVPSVHIVAAAEDQGVGGWDSSLLLSIMGLASTVGRVLFGWLSDRMGRKATLSFCSVTMGVSTMLWPALALMGFPGFVWYVVVFGMVSGSIVAILLPMIADFFGVKYLPVLSGISFAFSATGGLLGPPLAGWLYDLTQSYLVSALVAGGIMLVASVITFFLPQDGKHTFEGYEVISEISMAESSSSSESDQFYS